MKQSFMATRFEKAIELHKRYSRIYFSEVRENEKELVVAVRQTRSPNENYADKSKLEEITRELYALKTGFSKKLIVSSAPYTEAPSEIVTPEWIQDQMNKRNFSLKGLVEATGVSKSDLSALINGHKEMGIRTKGLFYYFFKSLDNNSDQRKIAMLEEEVETLTSEKKRLEKMLAHKTDPSLKTDVAGKRMKVRAKR